MQTFEEWLVNNHPESLDENWRRTLGSFALGAASLLPMANAQAAPPSGPQSAMTQSVSQNQQARLDAMKRVSSVHRFKKNWGSEFTPQQEQKLFDAIIKLQTEKDHNDFLYKIKKDQEDSMRGTAHPEPNVQQSEIRQVYNSFNYQYLDYIKALATASKMNL
jgi:hypothetical protein